MITFQNKKSFHFDRVRLSDKTISTLLVPSHLLPDLKQKTKEHGNSLVIYLRNLLWMCRTLTHSGMIPPPIKIKSEYQDEGLDLKRVNFRVGNSDWIELGELALAFGKSRCWLFVFLLKLDLVNMWRTLVEAGLNKIVPMIPNVELKVFQFLDRISYTFARGYHVKV